MPGPTVTVTAMTHRGAVRATNQDALVIGAFTACAVTLPDPVTWQAPLSTPILVAIADGMGGHAAGERAAAHAVRTLAAATPANEREVEAVVHRIDRDLLALSRTDPTAAGLGTTVAGVLLDPTSAFHFHAGDSRIYLEQGGYLAQLSTDDRGPSGGLTQCLGGRTDGSALRVTIQPLPDRPRILLCTDGLSDTVDTETMETLLTTNDDPRRIVKSLWAAAMNTSGHDNITIALIEPNTT